MLEDQSLESQHGDISAELFLRRAERPAPAGPLHSAIAQAEGVRTGAKQAKTPLAQKGAETAQSAAADRRAMVDAYIEEVRFKKSKRITRKDIWTAAGYKTRTEFERWQRQDQKHRNRAAERIFARILYEKPGAFDRSMQHHLIDLRFKDGVYEPTEAVETFSYAENGYLAPVEGWAVLA